MKITFGIITDGTQIKRLNQCIESIIQECEGSEYEIIIVGGQDKDLAFDGVKHIGFDETIKPGWITKKKNLIAQNTQYENLVLMHDYIALRQGWLEGFNKFDNEWLTCTNRIENADGTRFRDWCEIYNDAWMEPPIDSEIPPVYPAGKLIDYNKQPNPRWQYYSGAYFCVKKEVLLNIPFDETRIWGQGEDVQWCRLFYNHYRPLGQKFCFNPYSKVKFLKQKERAPWEN